MTNKRGEIHKGDNLLVIVRRNEKNENDGSIIVKRGGIAYCIAKAPRYATDEDWSHNANIIVEAVHRALGGGES